MANVDTVQAIFTNLEGILTTQGFNLEDVSSDPDLDTTPSATILFISEDFEESFGERPLYNTLTLHVAIRYNEGNPATARDKQAEFIHLIRDNVTIDALNVGAISSTKYVSRVDHVRAEIELNTPLSEIVYVLAIRYREI